MDGKGVAGTGRGGGVNETGVAGIGEYGVVGTDDIGGETGNKGLPGGGLTVLGGQMGGG